MSGLRSPIRPLVAHLLALALASASLSARAGNVIADITVAGPGEGEVGCSLFHGPDGFPMDAAKAVRSHWQPTSATLVCAFQDLPEGEYALAVSHDINGNRQVDTNFLGMPKEGWGVSGNVRPSLRAPRFAEAAFRVEDASTPLRIDIQVRR